MSRKNAVKVITVEEVDNRDVAGSSSSSYYTDGEESDYEEKAE